MSLYKGDKLIAGSTSPIDSYSTEEVKTNKVWIDGKPIYRKVVDFGTMPNAVNKTVNHNITNADNLWIDYSHSIVTDGNTYFPISYPNPDGTTYQIAFYLTKTSVTGMVRTNRSAYTAYITIEYTKTTD